MFENRPKETQYFYTDADADGQQLTGAAHYRITFAAGQLPPVDGFWSLTLYNETHFFHRNVLHRFSLGTKNKSLAYGDDRSLTLYASHDSPGTEHEPNWLPAPQGPFSLYLRAYSGQAPITNGTWIPPTINRH
jgi:hypothetical protein